MVFNSVSFLVFFLLFFFLYWWLNRKASSPIINLFLVASSYVFYGWWDWRFLGLIVISSISDYILGLKVGNSAASKTKKFYLILSLVINLGILAFFKYFNFFIEGFETLITGLGIKANYFSLNIILPVGISFYTFQTMSYCIDIYRGKIKPTNRPLQFFAFVSFFPQLVAGPIERAARFLPQFGHRKIFNYNKAIQGFRLILWGLFKKIVIADNFAVLVDEIFANPSDYSVFGILLGSLLFAFQIYCDFSGYSDIAIGLGKTLGFDLSANFKKPYFSSSFGEFWSRWHISLSTWFKDYVYIPLGGNRVSKGRKNFNLMATFLLSGLWHGANITFLIWGFLHGLALILEKKTKTTNLFKPLVIFFVCCLFWIPFRAENIDHLQALIAQLLSLEGAHFPVSILNDLYRYGSIALLFFVFVAFEYSMKDRNEIDHFNHSSKVVRLAFYYLLVLSILFLGNFDVKPNFIYFQF